MNQIVNFYLHASFHVSFAVLALVQMTFYFCHLPFDPVVSLMAFSGTLFSYNFIKYANVVYSQRKTLSARLKTIVFVSIIALAVGSICFLYLNTKAQIATLSLLVLAILYAVPINKNIPNLRNLAGLKVYIVCICWAAVTLLVPIYNAGMDVSIDIVLKLIQRFTLVLILIGIFEIVDLQFDDAKLRTLPQTLGIDRTKLFLFLLLVPFFVLEFFKVGFQPIQAWNSLGIVVLTSFFIWQASPKRTKFYTLFWVESVPIVWYLMVFVESLFEI